MPRTSAHPKVESFNFRMDPELKAAIAAAADRPAGQVLRDFMRGYVARRQERALIAEAKRQSLIVTHLVADPHSDEAEVMRWMEDVSDTEGWTV